MQTRIKLGIGVVAIATLAAIIFSARPDFFQGNFIKLGAPSIAPTDKNGSKSLGKAPVKLPAQTVAVPPVLQISQAALQTNFIAATMQDVAKFDVLNPIGNPTIELVSITFKCGGNSVLPYDFADNDYYVGVEGDGIRRGSTYDAGAPRATSNCLDGIYSNFMSYDLNQPVLLSGGQSVTVSIHYDTRMDEAPSATTSLQFYIPGNGLEWIVAANQANRRTDINGAYPIYGQTLTY